MSIIITNNGIADINHCIRSIIKRTSYANYEIIALISSDCANEIDKSLSSSTHLRIINRGDSGVASTRNYAATLAKLEYILFLDADIEVVNSGWLEEMLMYAQREDVGAVGAMIYNLDKTVYHAGIILGGGENRLAGFLFYGQAKGTVGYMGKLCYSQNVSAVSADCIMVKSDDFEKIGGFCEELVSYLCGIDFCLRLRNFGKLIVWTPYAELCKCNAGELVDVFSDVAKFRTLWAKELDTCDPYYNPNFICDK